MMYNVEMVNLVHDSDIYLVAAVYVEKVKRDFPLSYLMCIDGLLQCLVELSEMFWSPLLRMQLK